MRPALLALCLLAGPAFGQTTQVPAPVDALSLAELTAELDLEPCAQSNLLCLTLDLPLDPGLNDPDQTIGITYALSYAQVESRGILFYLVGGPGGSGLASAEGYLSAFNPSLTEYMDIVFIDQRGTGPDHGLSCPTAQAAFDTAPANLADPQGTLAMAQAYVTDCIAELDDTSILPFVDTNHAIADLEAFRQRIGAPRVWLYGESYGTQFVQAYATAYPDAVRGVILDGVVDLNLSAEGFYRSYTLASEAILSKTLQTCATIPECHADMGGDAAAVYDDLALRLSTSPIPVTVTLADGSRVDRSLTLAHLETNAFYALYSSGGRGEFLRILAAASHGNLQPMLQLGYLNMYIDPETEEAMEDPGWFGAAYYAITCADYGSGAGTVQDRTARILDEARALAPQAPRLLRFYYLERLACALWPHQGADTRPDPFAGGDWPTLVLNGTGDPITPIPMAWSVLDHVRNGYGIFMQGGPHVIWGRGYACPDAVLETLMYEGRLPLAHEQLCTQDFVQDYVPLTLTDPTAPTDALTFARAVETELYAFAPLGNWDGATETAFGCPEGGTVTMTSTDSGTGYAFAACQFWPGISLDGHGDEVAIDDAEDGLSLHLDVSGKQTGRIDFLSNRWNESLALSGTWNGMPASLPRTWP